jgi:Ca2+-binding EF-hand superfamily protein
MSMPKFNIAFFLADIGQIMFDDFEQVMKETVHAKIYVAKEKSVLEKAFERFDKDGTGRLNPSQLRRALKEFGVKVSQEDAEKMIDEADLDRDGMIDYYGRYM